MAAMVGSFQPDERNRFAGPVRPGLGALRRLRHAETAGGRAPAHRQGSLQRRPQPPRTGLDGGAALAARARAHRPHRRRGSAQGAGRGRGVHRAGPEGGRPRPHSVPAAVQARRRLTAGCAAAHAACRGHGFLRRPPGGRGAGGNAHPGPGCGRAGGGGLRSAALRGDAAAGDGRGRAGALRRCARQYFGGSALRRCGGDGRGAGEGRARDRNRDREPARRGDADGAALRARRIRQRPLDALHADAAADRDARRPRRRVQDQARAVPRRGRRPGRRLRHEDGLVSGRCARLPRGAQAFAPGEMARRPQRGVPRRAHGARPAFQGEPGARPRWCRCSWARRS